MQQRTVRTIGATVILAALAVVGLSQAGTGRDTPPAEIVATDTTTSVAHEESTSTTTSTSFVYTIGVLSGITTENFWAFYGEEPSVWNSYVLGPTKPALFTVDHATGALEPELAMSQPEPEQSEDGWFVEMELNMDLAWSDGTAITARDLVFTFETVRALELGGSWGDSFPETITSVEAESDDVVVIEFSERPRLAVWPHSVGLAPLMARHIWEPLVDDIRADDLYQISGDDDVSGGPLKVTEVDDSRIVSEANEGYALANPPDRVVYRIHEDEESAVAALEEGRIDFLLSPGGLDAGNLRRLAESRSIETITSPGNVIRYLGFNLRREPMSDAGFRNALALLIDRDGLDADPVAWSLVPEANTRWYDGESAARLAARYQTPMTRRLATALEGLQEAGYEWERAPAVEAGELVAGAGLTIDGRAPQPLTILTPGDEYDPARSDHARGITETLRMLGFDARLVETDFDTVVDLAFTPGEDGAFQYDMYMLGWTLGNPAHPSYYRALFAADGALNNTGYESSEFAAALEAYEGAFTVEEALEALWDMERAVARDLPYLLLHTNEVTEAYRSDRVSFDVVGALGGLQARLGGVWDVRPAD